MLELALVLWGLYSTSNPILIDSVPAQGDKVTICKTIADIVLMQTRDETASCKPYKKSTLRENNIKFITTNNIEITENNQTVTFKIFKVVIVESNAYDPDTKTTRAQIRNLGFVRVLIKAVA